MTMTRSFIVCLMLQPADRRTPTAADRRREWRVLPGRRALWQHGAASLLTVPTARPLDHCQSARPLIDRFNTVQRYPTVRPASRLINSEGHLNAAARGRSRLTAADELRETRTSACS